jgi:hypothetical protein
VLDAVWPVFWLVLMLLTVFSISVRPARESAISGLLPLSSLPHFSFYHACIVLIPITLILTEGITPHLLNPSIDFQMILMQNIPT